MGNQFYYTTASNEVAGPCTTLQLMALHKAGTLQDTSLVCADGSEQWVELKSIYPAARLQKSKKGPASPAPADDSKADPAVPPSEGASAKPTAKAGPALPASQTQAAAIILLLLLGLALPYFSALRPVAKWEYKKVTFQSQGHERIGPGALRYSSIEMDENLLNLMGKEGWEMVDSHLEMETAFPNFGKDDFVNGLQPNIRPQSLTLLFKRPAR
jgi:hypothetical protein